jgi:hypothetical protein
MRRSFGTFWSLNLQFGTVLDHAANLSSPRVDFVEFGVGSLSLKGVVFVEFARSEYLWNLKEVSICKI